MLAPTPEHRPDQAPADLRDLPRPWLGFIGALEDRIDWPLLTRLADEIPGGSIILIGRRPTPTGAAWEEDCQRCLNRPNVHLLGWRTQSQIGSYNQAFDLCLIPYRPDHPFNIACCPTKILDCMASGRPIVSTAVPECRLHEDLLAVAEDSEAFVSAVRAILEAGPEEDRARRAGNMPERIRVRGSWNASSRRCRANGRVPISFLGKKYPFILIPEG